MMGKGLSATQRTIRELRNQGCICGAVEKWNPYVGPHGIRQDLFGYIDIIALRPKGIAAIQCCASGRKAHIDKILMNEVAPEWLRSGGTIEVWYWRKVKLKRGGKAERWQARVDEITLESWDGEGPF